MDGLCKRHGSVERNFLGPMNNTEQGRIKYEKVSLFISLYLFIFQIPPQRLQQPSGDASATVIVLSFG